MTVRYAAIAAARDEDFTFISGDIISSNETKAKQIMIAIIDATFASPPSIFYGIISIVIFFPFCYNGKKYVIVLNSCRKSSYTYRKCMIVL